MTVTEETTFIVAITSPLHNKQNYFPNETLAHYSTWLNFYGEGIFSSANVLHKTADLNAKDVYFVWMGYGNRFPGDHGCFWRRQKYDD